jgi:endo-1,4-beta-xylanase
MKTLLTGFIVLAGFAVISTSCKKKSDAVDEYANLDTVSALKTVADFPIGAGVRLDLFKTDQAYVNLVKKHFNSLTFENEMKHVAIVSNEGLYNYTNADEFINLAQAAGLSVHGHTLVDYRSTNTTYLRSLTSASSEVNAVLNAGFESGTGNSFSNWNTQIAPQATGSFVAETAAPFDGARAMKVNAVTPGPEQYHIQAYSDMFSLTSGYSYTLSFYAKADVHGSRMKAVIQNSSYQEKTFFLTTAWERYTWTFTANESTLSLKFHFPFAGVFYLDNIDLPRPATGSYAIDPVKVDSALKQFITNSVTRYKNKITAWDVVNEAIDDAGKIRTNPNPGTVSGAYFYFAEYLGKDYIAKAFRYANAADPSAMLFINEENLESNSAKVDALVNLVNELKAQGIPIHGIGVQMHITISNSRSGIENAFQKLAATGLKIKISEMDVRINPWNYIGFQPTDDLLTQQRDMYRFVIGAYHKYVPAAQRYGVTVWDVTDKYSWIVTNQFHEDNPNLFDKNYNKKPAFYGMLVGLKNK